MEKGTPKFILSLLGIGIVIGVILTLAVIGVIMLSRTGNSIDKSVNAVISSDDTPSSIDEISSDESSKQIVESDIPTGGEPESIELMSGDTWESGRVYNSGETVQFHQRIYQSKWWTQGDVPNESDESNPWKYIGEAEVSSGYIIRYNQ